MKPVRAQSGFRSFFHGKEILVFAAVIGGGGIWGFGAQNISDGIFGPMGLAWLFQVVAFVIALCAVVLSCRVKAIRLTNAGFLVIGWLCAYLLLPSYLYLQGDGVLRAGMSSDESTIRIFYFHGQMFLGFGLVFSLINYFVSDYELRLSDKAMRLGRVILLVGMLPFALAVFTRLMSGGGVLPDSNYGEAWSGTVERASAAARAGGVIQFVGQLQSKLYFFAILLQGAGAGLLIADGRRNSKRKIVNFVLLVGFLLSALTFGSGGRSWVFMILLMGVYLAERIGSPFKLSHYAVGLVVAIFAFEFYGYFRTVRSMGLVQALPAAINNFRADESRFGEFKLMLLKEDRGIAIFKDNVQHGRFLFHSMLSWIPVQLAPWKLEVSSTSGELSMSFLGANAVNLGAGVAGAMTVDGYRLGGSLGCLAISAILGVFFGWVHLWESRLAGMPESRAFLKLVLGGGMAVASYNVIRGDLGVIANHIIYFLILPYVLSFLFPVNGRPPTAARMRTPQLRRISQMKGRRLSR